MFWQRALVTLTLAPLGLYLIYLGGWYFFIPVTVILIIATAEYANFMKHLGWYTPLWIMAPTVLLFLIDGQWPQLNLLGFILTGALFIILVYALWRYEKGTSKLASADWLATMGGIIILGWLGSHFMRLRGLDDSGQWALLTIFIVWLSDVFAYLVGSQFGRHRLVPRLSPNKSVEGYVAGIVFGTVGAVVVAYFFITTVPLLIILTLALILTTTSLAGDLSISLLKREAGVKDSGHLFPGHGGALDRLDTLLWGVAIAYYLIVYMV